MIPQDIEEGIRFLAAGTAITETVVHQYNRGERNGLGGVAATIAMGLQDAGEQVTLVTAVGEGQNGDQAARMLAARGLGDAVQRRSGGAGYARILTVNGEMGRAQGRWPRAHGLAGSVTALAHQHHCIIADCNMPPG